MGSVVSQQPYSVQNINGGSKSSGYIQMLIASKNSHPDQKLDFSKLKKVSKSILSEIYNNTNTPDTIKKKIEYVFEQKPTNKTYNLPEIAASYVPPVVEVIPEVKPKSEKMLALEQYRARQKQLKIENEVKQRADHQEQLNKQNEIICYRRKNEEIEREKQDAKMKAEAEEVKAEAIRRKQERLTPQLQQVVVNDDINDLISVQFLREAISLYYRFEGKTLTNLSKFNRDKLIAIIEKRKIPLHDLVKFYDMAIRNTIDMYKDSDSLKIIKLRKKWNELLIRK